MDRSSFSFKGSTNDFEKRQAFKAKLANQIEPPQPKELPPTDNTFNGVSPGGKLVHPSLGEGTLVEVNHGKNEVIIDFGTNGIVGLVISQAKSFVHAPVKAPEKGTAGVDDAFLGGEIQSRTIAPQDRDFRKVDFSKITSPDFVEPEKKFFAVGSTVWHPDLGVCTVSFVNEGANTILLTTQNDAQIDLVLSQVRSKLRQVEDVLEHVPMKPLVQEARGERFPTYKSRGEVSVSLPEVFKSWQKNQQFMFLTRSQHLTTDQANDVFSVLEGEKPLFHTVTVSWQTPEETMSMVTGVELKTDSGPLKEVKKLPTVYELQDKRIWHPDFGECSVSAFNERDNELVLQTSLGLKKIVLDVTLPKLAIMSPTDKVEHAPKQLEPKVQAPKAPIAKKAPVEIRLPEIFKSWKPAEQYQYLTGNSHLTPELANDVLAGKISILWTTELPETGKRSEYKQQLLARVENSSVEPVKPDLLVPVDPGIRRVIEEQTITRKETIKKLSVDIPIDFKSWTSSGQYVYLTRTKQLTFNEANDIMDSLQGKPLNSSSQYEINWLDVEPIAYGTDSGVRRITEEVDVIEKTPVLKKIVVTLPSDFKNWSESKQYSFLTRARQLTITEANEVLNTYRDVPFSSSVQYDIIWSE